MDKSRRQIIDRVKIASSVNFANIRRVRIRSGANLGGKASNPPGKTPEYLITLGTSLSGPNTVIRLLTRLSPALPAAVVVVQEIAPQILPAFIERFNEHVPWNIQMARDKQILEAGVCYVCSNEHALHLDRNENDQPCIYLGEAIEKPLNLLFESAAEIFGSKAIGVMLTGVGDDGAEGFGRIKESGGMTIAQDMQCCVYPNLTQNAIEMGTVTTIAEENQLPGVIERSIS